MSRRADLVSLVRLAFTVAGGLLIARASVTLMREKGLRKGASTALRASLAPETPVLAGLKLAREQDRALRVGAGLLMAATLVGLIAGGDGERD